MLYYKCGRMIMNFSVYLPQKLASQLSHIADQQHTSKNAIIREALEEWIVHHRTKRSWSKNFFDFQAGEDAPDFASYRSGLKSSKEDNVMKASRITQKSQATIPSEIRKVLDLHEGDLVGFEVNDKDVVIRKVIPLDLEFTKALEETVSEWASTEDDKLYADL